MSLTAQAWTVNGLATELCMDRRKVGKYVEGLEPVKVDGRSKYFRLRDVVQAIFGTGALDGPQERAKLDVAKRKKLELEIAEKRRELLPADEVKIYYSKLVMNARGRLLALPSALAPQLAVEGDVAACAILIKQGVYDALEELAEASVD